MKQNYQQDDTLQGSDVQNTNKQARINPSLTSKEYDCAFKQALAEWLVTFHEDSDTDDSELNEILKSNPHSREFRESSFWQLYSLMEDKLQNLKVKLVTTKF